MLRLLGRTAPAFKYLSGFGFFEPRVILSWDIPVSVFPSLHGPPPTPTPAATSPRASLWGCWGADHSVVLYLLLSLACRPPKFFPLFFHLFHRETS
uniref:Uncharacterized protein n=1 Tax=Knipowitschia caucasica TaxID=637954 RepID=A0AAV2MTD8_KNICA